jgi:hypothetical protein
MRDRVPQGACSVLVHAVAVPDQNVRRLDDE